tara:strand:+ start:2475 stop:3431 length:957 start_codon:yes stop_codon:yes gene_type:complete
MKFAILGCGSIGKRHLKNLIKLNIKKKEIILWDRSIKRKKEIPYKDIKFFTNMNEMFSLENPNTCFICTPSSLHIKHALKAASNNCNIFIEKPLTDDISDVDELRKIINDKKLIVSVAANMRFHQAVVEVKKIVENNIIGKVIWGHFFSGSYLPNWHPNEDYRSNYSAKRRLGGGCLLDNIHEVDLVHWFFGKPKKIIGNYYRTKTLEIQTEDMADIIFIYPDKNVTIHLDYIQYPAGRGIKLIGSKGWCEWSLENKYVLIFKEKKMKKIFLPKNYNKNTMYLDQMKYFISCLKNKINPVNDLKSGLAAVNSVLELKK